MIVRTLTLIAVIAIASIQDGKAQTVGDCEHGSAEADLDVNNVRARLYNNGNLFWKGSGHFYTVPKGSESNSIFTLGVWLGGIDDDGVIRFTGADYAPFEFWPGPLDETGAPPEDCSLYDRIYSVYRSDIEELDSGGTPTPDITDWPYELGAPVVDGDGVVGNYNLDGGDRPDIIGDQMAWWVMNDLGNSRTRPRSDPAEIEMQVSAFSFEDSTAFQNTTFYRYKILNKGSSNLSQTFFGLWTDVDLGNASDDYIASDSILGLGIGYNGKETDLGFDGYGDKPPAIGIDVLGGPTNSNNPGIDFTATNFMDTQFFSFTGWTNDVRHGLLQGIWHNGDPMTYGGTGIGGSNRAFFMFSGNPAKREFWSEENTDGYGSINTPSDRTFLLSAGPFNLPQGESEEITFAIIWSQADSRLASYVKLIEDDIYIQGLYDRGFVPQPEIEPPIVSASTYEDDIIITWENPPSSNNYLDPYEERSGYVYNKLDPDADLTYNFEGYDIIQFESYEDSVGQVIATYDLRNNINFFTEEVYDYESELYVNVVAATGNDGGLQHHHVVEDITLYQDYYFGVQPYAYNERSRPRIHRGAINRVHIVATPADPTIDAANALAGQRISSSRLIGTGDSMQVYATVVNPNEIEDISYTVHVDSLRTESVLVYTVEDETGVTLANQMRLEPDFFDGPPGAQDFIVDRGLSFSIEQSEQTFADFLAVANGAGVIDPPTGAAADFRGFPVPERPSSNQQVGNGVWFFHTVDDSSTSNFSAYQFFVDAVSPGVSGPGPFDIEVKFGLTPSAGYNLRSGELVDLPFSVWNIGSATPDDPTDDYQYIIGIVDHDDNGFSLRWLDHRASTADNDPFTDEFTIFEPLDQSPGSVGYNEWLARTQQGEDATEHGTFVLQELVLINWNGGAVGAANGLDDYLENVVDQLLPEPGTVFRIETTRPLADGDVFVIDPSSLAPTLKDDDSLPTILADIGIVPNPYKGASAYEIGGPERRVRFTSLPERATIRVFTIAGTLVRQLEKNSSLPYLDWDLLTDEGFVLGSGLFLVHVTVPGVGERVIKFGHVSRRN